MYVSSDIMDKLEVSKEFTRKIEMTQIAEGGLGIETRVTDIDGVTLMEVVDDERFYDRFDWDVAEGGFAPLKSKYAITTDTDVAEGKTYYTKSDSTYTVVAKPTKTNIATYYEKLFRAHARLMYLSHVDRHVRQYLRFHLFISSHQEHIQKETDIFIRIAS